MPTPVITSENKILGNNFRLYLIEESTNTPVPTENNVGLSISNGLVDSTDKRVDWAQFIDGVKGWTVSEEFHYTQVKEDPGFKLVQKLISGDTRTPVIIGKISEEGDIAFKGYVRISDVEVSAASNELMTCSMSLTGDGELEIVEKTAAA